MAALILGMIVFGGLAGRYGTAEVDEVGLPEDELKYMIQKRKMDLLELGFWNGLPHGRAMRDKKSPNVQWHSLCTAWFIHELFTDE